MTRRFHLIGHLLVFHTAVRWKELHGSFDKTKVGCFERALERLLDEKREKGLCDSRRGHAGGFSLNNFDAQVSSISSGK